MKRSLTGNGRGRPAHHKPHTFMFATGIENSYPVVTGPDGGDLRVDEMAKCGHYQRWKEDFRWCGNWGSNFCGSARRITGNIARPGKYDWDFADQTFAELRRTGIHPIVDLCHFGVPDWAGNFQNPDWPELFAEYARAFAQRFPWVRFYTPVNEIFVTATFSGQYGWWNERLKSDQAFVTALKHLAKANLLAEEAILRGAAARAVHPERIHRIFPCADPAAQSRAAAFNQPALPVARPFLRPRRARRDVRVPDGQRHDARGIPLVPANGGAPAALLRDGQRLLHHQRAPGAEPGAGHVRPARFSATT